MCLTPIYLALLPVLASAIPSPRSSSILNSSYVNPVFQQSWANIEDNSLASIRELLSRADYPTGYIGQNGFTAVAQWDVQHNTTTFADAFYKNESYYATHPIFGCYDYWMNPLTDCFNDDAGWAALANLEGYSAYEDVGYLQNATKVWEFVSNHGFINETVIEEGYLKGTHFPSNTLKPTCYGQSMYGGVYWENGSPSDPTKSSKHAAHNTAIDSGSTVLYALLSAKLCAIYNDTSYCDRSYDALQFMDRFMINPTNGLITGHIDGKTCKRVVDLINTPSVGNYIAAYALLSNLTGNATALSIARATTIRGLTSAVFNTAQGVFFDNGPHRRVGGAFTAGLKSVWIRRLREVHAYMDADVQAAITQYVNIQYWSMVNRDSDDARAPLVYGEAWDGPKFRAKDVSGRSQLLAIDVLNALALNPTSAFPDTNSTDVPVISI